MCDHENIWFAIRIVGVFGILSIGLLTLCIFILRNKFYKF